MSDIQLPNSYMAMAITEFGDSQVLKLIEKPLKLPAPDEVLIRAISASINPIDLKTRAGLSWAAQQNADKLPMVAGYDCYGEVVAVGESVIDLSCGDLVIGMVGFPLAAGSYAQYVIACADDVVPVSSHSTLDIAALPLAGLTAYQGLFDFGQLQRADTVVISAAAGGVGHIAVQLAALHGANVIAIASEKNHAMLHNLGAKAVVSYNDPSQFASLDNIDLWFDLIGGDAAMAQLESAGHIKRLVTVPTITAEQVCGAVAARGCNAQGMLVKPDKNQLTKLAQLVESSKISLNIVKHLDYNHAPQAHRLIEQAKVSGKIILSINQ